MSLVLDYYAALLAANLPVINARNVPPLQCDLDPSATQQQLAQAATITATYQARGERKPLPLPTVLAAVQALSTADQKALFTAASAFALTLDDLPVQTVNASANANNGANPHAALLSARIVQLYPKFARNLGIAVDGDTAA